MEDKRRLYKPAPGIDPSATPEYGSRKPLAQGKLTTTVDFQESSLSPTQDIIVSKATPMKLTPVKSRKCETEDLHGTPRRNSPRRMSPLSPNQQQPLSDLSLSESELDTRLLSSQRRHHATPRSLAYATRITEVQALDSSRNDPDAEVETVVSQVLSPVKVICHSLSPRDEESFSGGRNYQTAAQGSDAASPVRDADSVVEHSPKLMKVMPDDHLEGLGEMNQNASQKSEEKQKPKMKKPKGRIIQSKYMSRSSSTSQLKTSNPMNSSSILPSKNRSAEATSGVPSRSKGNPSKTGMSLLQDISAILPSAPSKPQRPRVSSNKQPKQHATSTPFVASAQHKPIATRKDLASDGSFLDPANSSSKRHSRNISGDRRPVARESPLKSGKEVNADGHSQLRLDLEYVRLMQSMYLNVKTKQTFEKQEKEAMYHIYRAWQENETIKQDIDKLALSIATTRHAIMLDQVLNIQAAKLKPCVGQLNRLEKCYSKTCQALDNTRHYMPVNEAHIGDIDLLCRALREGLEELKDISLLTHNQKDGIGSFAQDMSLLSNTLHSEAEEQLRISHLLTKTNSLIQNERSLQVGSMQHRRELAFADE